MYLHLGADAAARWDEVVGVFDLDNSSRSHLTRAFLAAAEKRGQVRSAAEEELPKSFVVCSGATGQTVWLSQLNPSTLCRRSEAAGIE